MQNPLNRFNYLFGETEALYHELSLRIGLSDSATKILYTLCDNGGSCLLQEICRRSGLRKQTAHSALAKLEAAGIIYRQATDARAKRIGLTPAGQALAQKTVMRIIRMENDVFASWPEEDVARYLALTERFLRDLGQRAGQMEAPAAGEVSV